jgi:Zn-dependent peptidase ImmA (M78 family)/transcriptional regulator with XRE-family HTH domain
MIIMPRKSLSVEINPTVFIWLRKSAGWTQEEVAKRLNTSVETIQKIESGQKHPTLRQLRILASSFKRPIAAFFLTDPIPEKPKPKDYRMLPQRKNQFDKKTLLVIRKARQMQKICRNLSRNIQTRTIPNINHISLHDPPDRLAQKYRDLFKLTEQQHKFKNTYDFFNFLRNKLEDINIFVFQHSMPLEDARGFVLVDEQPVVIMVNTKDTIEARVFTLMHEFAHVLLGESSIDLPRYTLNMKNSTERWCNEFASSFLLPKDLAHTLFNQGEVNIHQLSNRYKISQQMIMVNMVKLGYMSKDEYQEKMKTYAEKTSKESSTGGAIPSEKKRLSEYGNKFISLVAHNYDHDHLLTDLITI